MSKSSARTSRSSRSVKRRPTEPSDGVFYFGFAMMAVFMLALGYLVASDSVPYLIIGLAVLFLVLVHVDAWRAYKGRRLRTWQKTFARTSLRFGGFGTKGGKPVTAAKNVEKAKKTIFITGGVSIVLLALLCWVVLEWLG